MGRVRYLSDLKTHLLKAFFGLVFKSFSKKNFKSCQVSRTGTVMKALGPFLARAPGCEADGLAEFVTLTRGAQRGQDAEHCREEPRTAPPARTPPPRLFASLSRSAMAQGAQRGTDAERCREEARTSPPKPQTLPAPSSPPKPQTLPPPYAPPARNSARTPPPRLFASISRSALGSLDVRCART